ncbi:hypothetical protein G6F40_015275 [Rhizopus arrhizus]|nr:hypothetical protein G6F40_015275 [Rhizopus arrhizus]
MPDHNPVLGPSATVPGLFHAFGLSGAGFQIGPAVGEVLSELVVRGQSSIPLEAYPFDRYTAAAHGAAGRPERRIAPEQGEVAAGRGDDDVAGRGRHGAAEDAVRRHERRRHGARLHAVRVSGFRESQQREDRRGARHLDGRAGESAGLQG